MRRELGSIYKTLLINSVQRKRGSKAAPVINQNKPTHCCRRHDLFIVPHNSQLLLN